MTDVQPPSEDTPSPSALTPEEGEAAAAPPIGLALRPLLQVHQDRLTALRAALLEQRVVLSRDDPAAIEQKTDLVALHAQHVGHAADHVRRRALGLGLTPADTSLDGVIQAVEAAGDTETGALARAVREVGMLAAQDAVINRRLAEGHLQVSKGLIEAIRQAVTRDPLSYDRQDPPEAPAGAIVSRYV